MKTIFTFLVLCGTAYGEQYPYFASYAFPATTFSPTDIKWELRTATDDAVSWTWAAKPVSVPPNRPYQQYQVMEPTAAGRGVDWAAWETAVLDPAYNRSLVTFAGVTQELPWPDPLFPREPRYQSLDSLSFILADWHNNPTAQGAQPVNIVVRAYSKLQVPEPATWLLLLLGICVVRYPRRLHR